MSKKAAYYERCRTLYVEEGYSIRAIAAMVQKGHQDAPTRRAIQYWAEDGNWEEKRKKFVEQEDDLFAVTREVAAMAGKNAKENPTPENINSFVRILSVLKYKEQIKSINELPEDPESGPSKKEKLQDMMNQVMELMEG